MSITSANPGSHVSAMSGTFTGIAQAPMSVRGIRVGTAAFLPGTWIIVSARCAAKEKGTVTGTMNVAAALYVCKMWGPIMGSVPAWMFANQQIGVMVGPTACL